MAPPLVTDLRIDITVPGAGHWVQQEAPEETTAALLSFLDTTDERKRR
jgi:pimeloyl-ACP methyl ester carboxylesterase